MHPAVAGMAGNKSPGWLFIGNRQPERNGPLPGHYQFDTRWSSSPTIRRGDLIWMTPFEMVGGNMQV
jgi:hypothetical protein